MTESWIQSTWLFMSGNSIKLKDNTPFIPLGREEDKILMEHFMLQGYKGIELRNINCCRLYLKVITLADITSGDGKTITKEAWDVKKVDTQNRHNNFEWPNWDSISTTAIATWKLALIQRFCRTRERHLDTPLGDWIEPISLAIRFISISSKTKSSKIQIL